MTTDPSVFYLEGDAVRPHGGVHPNRIICHIVNDAGKWGSGFVVPLAERWPDAEQAYRDWSYGTLKPSFTVGMTGPMQLGQSMSLIVDPNIMILNMCAQRGIRAYVGEQVVDYSALAACMKTARLTALLNGASIHMPRIGTQRGGGTWEEVVETFTRHGIEKPNEPDIYVYTPAPGVKTG